MASEPNAQSTKEPSASVLWQRHVDRALRIEADPNRRWHHEGTVNGWSSWSCVPAHTAIEEGWVADHEPALPGWPTIPPFAPLVEALLTVFPTSDGTGWEQFPTSRAWAEAKAAALRAALSGTSK